MDLLKIQKKKKILRCPCMAGGSKTLRMKFTKGREGADMRNLAVIIRVGIIEADRIGK